MKMIRFIVEKGKSILAWSYIMAMFFVIPLYHRGTYDSISQRKVEAFYFIGIVALALYFIISIAVDFRNNYESDKKEMTGLSTTDVAMIVFGASSVLAFAFSSYRKEALYGVPGFGMGLLTVVLMILSYFLISRNLILNDMIFHFITLSSIPSVFIAIVNRLGYDPLHLYPEGSDTKTHLYVSTFGNYSVFSEYLTFIIPVVLCMLILSKRNAIRIFYAVYLVILLWAIRLAGTGMLYLSIASVIVFLILNKFCSKNGRITDLLIRTMLILLPVVYCIFILFGSGKDSFANDRGYIWKLSVDLYKNLSPFKKIVGVGPNCYMYAFDDYLVLHPALIDEVNERFRYLALTSAHSDYFDYLINTGLFGLISYFTMIGMVIRRFYKREHRSLATIISMACMVSYLTYTMINFSIICATPYLYIFMGIVSSESNKEVCKKKTE